MICSKKQLEFSNTAGIFAFSFVNPSDKQATFCIKKSAKMMIYQCFSSNKHSPFEKRKKQRKPLWGVELIGVMAGREA